MVLKRLTASKGEERLYRALLDKFDSGKAPRVHLKVRLADVFDMEDARWIEEEKRYMLQSHFDFLIVKDDGMPVMALEYDGSYHEREVQKERDRIKNDICRKGSLRLLRIRGEELGRYSLESLLSDKVDPCLAYERFLCIMVAFRVWCLLSANRLEDQTAEIRQGGQKVLSMAQAIHCSRLLKVSNEDLSHLHSSDFKLALTNEIEELVPENSLVGIRLACLEAIAKRVAGLTPGVPSDIVEQVIDTAKRESEAWINLVYKEY